MNLRHFQERYRKIIFFVFLFILPVVAKCTVEDIIADKQLKVTMRMIGHEVLKCLGDNESRILPIEKLSTGTYRISFESELGFDPENMVDLIDRVMNQSNINKDYLVEVEQCGTKEVVHSFQIGNELDPSRTPCGGRILPKDCYHLVITLLGHDSFVKGSKDSYMNTGPVSPENPDLASFLVPLLILIGFMGYFIKKKQGPETDPNLILIGASQFDTKNMTLRFQDKKVDLSHKEAELLTVLHSSANAAVERETILQRVWGDDGAYVGRTLDVFISKLRKKLEADASVKIVNIRGVGYKLVMG